MSKSFILLLLTICLVAFSKQQQCGPNQVYKTCGPICPPACDTTRHIICPKICVRGCFCATGYVSVSHKSRDCIPSSLCPR